MIDDWKMILETKETNKRAQSVTKEWRTQSYVASGYPSWLHSLFVMENGLSSANDIPSIGFLFVK